jgi:hypothetical protein
MLMDSAMRARQASSSICIRWLPGWKFSSQPQLLAALHFIKKGIAGFFQRFFNRMTEVNQVAVVKDLARPVVILFTGGFEIINHVVVSGAARHWRWFLVNRAKAVASISAARMAALARPPAALTCAPTYFIKKLLLTRKAYDSGLTGEGREGLCHQAVDGEVNRAAADNQPDEEHQRHQQRFRTGFFSALT